MMRVQHIRAVSWILILGSTASGEDRISGDAVIRAPAGESEIVIRTTSRLAAAIDSLTWDGVEFVDSADHGRQIQSAANFDAGHPFHPELFNPTEAGSRFDGAGPRSSSVLLHLDARGHTLSTVNQPAFWLRPGERSGGRLALNDAIVSNHRISKRVTIGHRSLPRVIRYEVLFTVPSGERHTFAQFEAVTGYMPPRFSRFLRFDPSSRRLETLDDGPGEQADPVVFATPDGRYAMGVFSPDQPSPGFENAGYGRFRFTNERVVKWNTVFRERSRSGITGGERPFLVFLVVGRLDQVRNDLATLLDEARAERRRRPEP
jgi:hypothetical protein